MDTRIEIKKLEVADVALFSRMVKLFEDVFEMKNFKSPHVSHLQKTLENENFMAFIASVSQEIVGGNLSRYGDSSYSGINI